MKAKKEPWIIVTEKNGNVHRFNYYTICSLHNIKEDVVLTQTNGKSHTFVGDAAAKSCLEQWERIVNKEEN
jgi:hypothetical protein